MSLASADEERGVEKKKESPVRLKVFESKKEKKRKLILSDSDSEEDSVYPFKREALVAEQNGSFSLADIGPEPARCDDERKDDVKLNAEVGPDDILVKELKSDKEEIKFYRKKGPGSLVRQREEGVSDEKKVKDLGSEKELNFDKKRAMGSGITKLREVKVGVNNKKATELGSDGKEPKLDSNLGMMRSDVFKRRDETAEFRSHKDLDFDKRRDMGSDFIKKKEEVGTDKKKYAESVSDKGDVKSDKKAMGSDVKQREEVVVDRKKLRDSGFDSKSDRKRSRETPDLETSSKKVQLESVSNKGDVKSDKKAMGSVVKRREEVVVDRKKLRDSGFDSKSDRKRSRETPDLETSSKKDKLEPFKRGQDQKKEIGGTKIKEFSFRHTDKRPDKRVEIKRSKPVILAGRPRNGPIEKKSSQPNLNKTAKVATEEASSMERSGQRSVQKLKDSTTHAAGLKKEEPGTTQRKDASVQGKGGVLTVSPSNEKAGGLEKAHMQTNGEERTKTSTPSASDKDRTMSAKHTSLSGEKNVPEKPSTLPASDKRQFDMKKNSSAEKQKPRGVSTKPKNNISSAHKHKSHETKTNLRSSSRKMEPKIVAPPSRKPDTVVKGGRESGSKNLPSTKQNTEESTEGRATVRRKIREQIKDILFSAGWRIDLRPRRGRDYEDQVYIPPTGGGGYWSITKAYAVYQKTQSSCVRDDKSKKSSKMSSGSDHNIDGTSTSFAMIPTEVLNMLKRNVVNKRRQRIEDDEIEGSRRKKAKKSTKMKGPENIGGVRGRKKLNGLVGKRNKSQHGCALLVRGANQEADAECDDYVPYIWKRTVLSWMVDLGIVPPNGKVSYMNKKQTRKLLEGRITRDGINCSCCSKILTVSKFEIHAGSKLHQPYENIFVQESGISLLQCQLNAWKKQESERKGSYTIIIEGDDPNDDTCSICGDGGDLICCDGCPSTFHQSCLGIEVLPPGDWHCAYCRCRYCGLVSEDSTQGGDIPVSPLLSCSQCEEKYHQDCIPEADVISTGSDKSQALFCGRSCRKVFRQLRKLLGVKNDLEAGFSWRLIHRLDEDSPIYPYTLPRRAECNAKVAVALTVMDECFLPIIEQRSGTNLIHNVVYNCGSNINRLNYNGFYTFTLERGDEIISAASVRIHGTRMAEMPFIGTRNTYRRQGMCRRLLNGIESALCTLGIEKLIIPAISELAVTWTTVFGFKPLDISQKNEAKFTNMLVFPSTGLLQKPLVKKDLAEQDITTDEADKVEIKHDIVLEVAAESSLLPNHATDGTIIDSKEDKDALPSFTGLGGCVHTTPTESLNAPHGSEFQDQECKSPENVGNHPGAVCRDETMEGDRVEVSSLIVPEIKLPCDATVHDHHDVEIENAGLESMNAVEDQECKSPVNMGNHHDETMEGDRVEVSSLIVPEIKLPCDATVHDHHDVEIEIAGLESMNAVEDQECKAPENMGNHPGAVCRNETIEGERVEVSSLIVPEIKLPCDATVHDHHDLEIENAGLESMNAVEDQECKSPENMGNHPGAVCRDETMEGDRVEVSSLIVPEIKLPCDATVHDHHDVEIENAGLESMNAVEDTPIRLTSEAKCTLSAATSSALQDSDTNAAPNLRYVHGTLLLHSSEPHCVSSGETAPTMEDCAGNNLHIPFSSLKSGSEATQKISSDIRSTLFPAEHCTQASMECTVKDNHDLQSSETEKLTQQDSELIQGSPEFPCVAHPFFIEKSEDNKHDMADVSHSPSLSESANSSANGRMLKTSHETRVDCGSSEKNSCGFGVNSEQYHTPEMPCGSETAARNADNCTLDVVAQNFVMGDSVTSVDTFNERFENAPSARDSGSINVCTKNDFSDDICNLGGLVKYNEAVPGQPLNEISDSAMVIVQHDSRVEDEASIDESDTGISVDELAIAKHAHTFSTGSHCACTVTKPLENCSESTNGSTKASIV